jgi:hypothetical protein
METVRERIDPFSCHPPPAAFFFSVLSAGAKETNGFIYLAYVGAIILTIGLLALGVGLLRGPSRA